MPEVEDDPNFVKLCDGLSEIAGFAAVHATTASEFDRLFQTLVGCIAGITTADMKGESTSYDFAAILDPVIRSELVKFRQAVSEQVTK